MIKSASRPLGNTSDAGRRAGGGALPPWLERLSGKPSGPPVIQLGGNEQRINDQAIAALTGVYQQSGALTRAIVTATKG